MIRDLYDIIIGLKGLVVSSLEDGMTASCDDHFFHWVGPGGSGGVGNTPDHANY